MSKPVPNSKIEGRNRCSSAVADTDFSPALRIGLQNELFMYLPFCNVKVEMFLKQFNNGKTFLLFPPTNTRVKDFICQEVKQGNGSDNRTKISRASITDQRLLSFVVAKLLLRFGCF